MSGASPTDDESNRSAGFQAGASEAEDFSVDLERPFAEAARASNAEVREAWIGLDSMFKGIHERIGPVDRERIRRRNALYDLLEDNGVEAMALLQVLKELHPEHAIDVAMAVEADARDAWNQTHVEAQQLALAQMLHEARLG